MIVFSCPGCQKQLTLKDELADKRVHCPSCRQPVSVPTGPVLQGSASSSRTSAALTRAPESIPAAPAGSSAKGRPATQNMASSDEATLVPREAGQDESRELVDFLAPPQAPDELGRLGGFRILKVLGHGGMGVVFQGEDPRLGRKVAIKAMLPHLAGSRSSQERFLREARAAAALEHDHIVPILQVGEDCGAPFIVMPFLKGEPLDERLKRQQKPPLAEVVRIGREVAEGLAAAHAAGLIHRDIKPANLWLEGDEGRVKILDFGLARAAADSAQLTQSGAILGTPAYMAPEQAGGEKVDGRCDLWSLGVVLYQLCTGKLPFQGNDTLSTLMALATEQPVDPHELNPDVPAELSSLIMSLLQKDRDQRPGSATELIDQLRELELRLRASAGHNLPETLVDKKSLKGPAEKRRRSRLMRGGALLLTLLAIGAVALSVIRISGPEGDYVIETDDPDFSFKVSHGTVVLDDTRLGRQYKLKVLRQRSGEFELELADSASDLVFTAKTITIRRNEKVALKTWFERKALANTGPPRSVEVAPVEARFPDTPRFPPGQSALAFFANKAYVDIPTLERDVPGVITFEAWINYRNAPSFSSLIMRIQGKAPCQINIDRPAGVLAGREFSSKGQKRAVWGDRPVPCHVWTHVCYVLDKEEARLFINGRLSGALTGPILAELFEPAKDRGSGIGGTAAITGWRFRGLMRGLRVSRSARYQWDFTPPIRLEKDKDTLALYQFDEGSGEVLHDSSGNGHHGKIIGATWVRADGEESKVPSKAKTQP